MGAPFCILPPHRRKVIESEIEMHLQRVELLIARLDRADAPFEDMEDDDPAATDLDKGEAPTDDGTVLLAALPRYAVDQRGEPTNFDVAFRVHKAAEMGLVPNGRGGWRASS